MTTTGEDTRPLPLIGQAVGQAQASLTRLLTGILAGTGTSYPVWLGLQRLNALGGQPSREAYEADLSYWLQLDGPAAARLAGDVVAAGLAASGDDGSVALSARGRALREEVLAASAKVTGPMLATIDRADLDTTIRTLEKITRRARTYGGKPMTTQNLPGTDAARHGTGDADLTIMLAAHDAFRRDLTRLVRAAAAADLSDPARRRSVAAGWELFKHELHLHHTAEDEVIWPVLRPRLAHSEHALSVLDAMEEEHERIDPLLAAVDAAFAPRREDALADVIDALVTHADRAPRARGAGRPAADRRGPDRRRMAQRRLQDRAQERPVRGRQDVRLDPGRRRRRPPATPPPPCAPCRPRCASSTAPSGSPATTKPRAGNPASPLFTPTPERRNRISTPPSDWGERPPAPDTWGGAPHPARPLLPAPCRFAQMRR